MTRAVELAQVASLGVSEAFKNRIINGAMVIDQRNAGASVTFTGLTYVLDRFFTYNDTSATGNLQRSTIAPTGFTNSLSVTITGSATASSSQEAEIIQRIEGFNIADLGWGTANAKTVTLSFWVCSSVTGIFSGGVTNATGTRRGYVFNYTINQANTFEYKTVTIVGPTDGTWSTNNSTGMSILFDLGSGSNLIGTANTWNNSAVFKSAGSVNLIATNGATFYITGVQLEVGSSATSFEYRPYGTELQLAQRYFQICAFSGVAHNTSEMGIASQNKVTMRAQASMSTVLYNVDNYTGSANTIERIGIGNTSVGSASYNAPSTGNNIGNILCTGLTTGGIYFGSFQASAEL